MNDAHAVRLVLIPGVGADARLFLPQRRAFPGAEVLPWLPPRPREALREYAARMAASAQDRRPMVLVGVSFGGMLALEMAAHLPFRGVVLIASCRSGRAVSRLAVPLERLGRVLPEGAIELLRRSRIGVGAAMGPVGQAERDVLLEMLAAAPLELVRWSGRAILEWAGAESPGVPVRHLHGERDRIIPCGRVEADEVVEGAGHLVNLTHPERANAFIAESIRAFGCEPADRSSAAVETSCPSAPSAGTSASGG